MPNFIGTTVHLPCKVLKFQDSSAIVEACDGGQVEVRLHPSDELTCVYTEIVGQVLDPSTMKFLTAVDLHVEPGKELDMKLVNDVVELTFDPRFKKIFFSS